LAVVEIDGVKVGAGEGGAEASFSRSWKKYVGDLSS
jgi:hypothetical protein